MNLQSLYAGGPTASASERCNQFHGKRSLGFPGGSGGIASAYNAGDGSSIPGSRRSSGKGNGNPLQYSCLQNPMDGGAW